MTKASLERLIRIHKRYHTDPNEACRVCEIVWTEAMKVPGFNEAMEQGLADLKAGRTHRWSDVRRKY